MSTRFQAVIFLLDMSGLSGVALAQQLRERGTEDPADSAIRMRVLQERMRIPGPVRLRHAAAGRSAGSAPSIEGVAARSRPHRAQTATPCRS